MNPDQHITDRELEILKLISEGKTNAQIAMELNLSEWTVETHRKNINQKLGSNSAATLLMEAKKQGLI